MLGRGCNYQCFTAYAKVRSESNFSFGHIFFFLFVFFCACVFVVFLFCEAEAAERLKLIKNTAIAEGEIFLV